MYEKWVDKLKKITKLFITAKCELRIQIKSETDTVVNFLLFVQLSPLHDHTSVTGAPFSGY